MTAVEKLCNARISAIRLAVFQKRMILPLAQREVAALRNLIAAAQADERYKLLTHRECTGNG